MARSVATRVWVSSAGRSAGEIGGGFVGSDAFPGAVVAFRHVVGLPNPAVWTVGSAHGEKRQPALVWADRASGYKFKYFFLNHFILQQNTGRPVAESLGHEQPPL
jgi:hypothetical protein